MFIMTAAETQLIESKFVKRYQIFEKDDAVLVSGIYDDTSHVITLGRYADMDEAKAALTNLLYALAGGQTHYFMPDSRLFYEQPKKYDARTRRKGGS